MPNFCAAKGCSSSSHRNRGKGFFRIPKIISHQGAKTEQVSTARRMQWLANIGRDDLTENKLPYTRICSDHFISGRPSSLYDISSQDWAPTQNMGYFLPVGSGPMKQELSWFSDQLSSLSETDVAETSGSTFAIYETPSDTLTSKRAFQLGLSRDSIDMKSDNKRRRNTAPRFHTPEEENSNSFITVIEEEPGSQNCHIGCQTDLTGSDIDHMLMQINRQQGKLREIKLICSE